MNDDELGEPDGYIDVDGRPMAYWMPKEKKSEPETAKDDAEKVGDDLPPF